MTSEIYMEHTIDTGHRIVGHKGKCARLHGHTYKFEIRINGHISDIGFVVDFGDVKELLNDWDHRLLLWNQDPLCGPDHEGFWIDEGVVWVGFNPTVENMALRTAQRIVTELNTLDCQIDLWETPKCAARAYWHHEYRIEP